MVVEIWGMGPSAPTRNLFLVCDAIGVEYKIHVIDLFKGENRTPEYLKVPSQFHYFFFSFVILFIPLFEIQMNPQHTIPTLKDGNFIMNESRAAACYLVNKYAKDDKLYPKDVKMRAIIDSRLYFDMGTFYKAAGDIMVLLDNIRIS